MCILGTCKAGCFNETPSTPQRAAAARWLPVQERRRLAPVAPDSWWAPVSHPPAEQAGSFVSTNTGASGLISKPCSTRSPSIRWANRVTPTRQFPGSVSRIQKCEGVYNRSPGSFVEKRDRRYDTEQTCGFCMRPQPDTECEVGRNTVFGACAYSGIVGAGRHSLFFLVGRVDVPGKLGPARQFFLSIREFQFDNFRKVCIYTL